MSATTSQQDGDVGASNTSSFVSAVVVAAITLGAFTAVWAVLHSRKKFATRVYQPRVEFAPEGKKPKPLPLGIVSFWRTVVGTPDQDLVVSNGLDAYLFVRFLKVFGVKLLLPYFLLTFVVCIPLAAAGQTAGLQGLNILTFGNVSPYHTERRIGHMLVALILMGWTAYTLWREYQHFVAVRQAWLTSQQHLSLARSRTVVFTGIPDDYNSLSGLNGLVQTVNSMPGNKAPRISMADDRTVTNGSDDNIASAPQIWMGKKVKEVEKVWEDRDKECGRLEGGVGKLLKLAAKNQKKGKTPEKQGKYDAERDSSYLAHRYVLPKKVPTWKQGFLGLIGQKQTFETSPEYIAEKNAELEKLRAQEFEQGNTAFLRFSSQHEAHNFARLASTAGGKSLRLASSSVEVVPEDVEWTNMSMSAPQRKSRKILSWAITIGIIITWAVPVAFVGSVTNVDKLCQQAPWLAWVCQLPAPAVGIIRGVLPPAGLAILFAVLPMVLRLLVKLQGEVLKSEIEMKLFSRFWLFQVIHGFLIITLASGLINALSQLGETAGSVPTLLATELPGASIFFLTFILTVTFAGAAKGYAQVVPFIMFNLRGLLGGNTPRKWYNSQWKMSNYKWATVWPPICLLTTITIVYSVIQPIITLLAMLAFCVLYAAYKYQLNWVADQPDYLETGGLFYIKAIRTVFVALYLEGICLAGLFFLSTNQNGDRAPSGLACGAIMAVATGLIAGFQFYIDWFAFRKPYLVYVHSTHPVKNGTGTLAEPKLASIPTNPSVAAEHAGPELGNTTGFHEQAFEHPALWKKQPCIWIADDTLGLGRDMADRINAKRVEASTEYATMDADGKLDVTRGPPDEAWFGGRTT